MLSSNFRGSFITILQLSSVKVLMYKTWLEIKMLKKSMLKKYNGIRIH